MLKIAQIGVGYWGPNLIRNLMSNKYCDVKIVADISKDRQTFIKDLYPSVNVCDQGWHAINDPDIDAVVIATPAKTHFEFVLEALNAGKHVLVEKPMATSTAEVIEIEKLSKAKDLVVMAGHTFLFNSAVRYVKQLIDSNQLGDIRYIYSQRINLGRIRSDVDALWNLAPHDVSIIQYWLGDTDPIKVERWGMDYIQRGINDVVFMNIEYPNKIMANIHVSWLDPNKIRRMTVVGSKKMVVYDDIADNKIAIFDKGIDQMAILGQNMDYDQTDFIKYNHRSGDILLPKITFEEPLKVEISHFVDCILNGIKCLTGPHHAFKVVEILSDKIHNKSNS